MDFYPEGTYSNNTKNGYDLITLTNAMENNATLEGRATVCDGEYNLWVDLGTVKGVIRKEETAYSHDGNAVKDIAIISRVGKSVCFKVKGFANNKQGEKIALLSRKEAQIECLKKIMKVPFGSILTAKITHLDSFGAFCDVGCGNIALLPIDMISVSRISHSCDRFYNGQIIKVLLKNIDDDGKITVSHKELLGTWEENAAAFLAGQTVSGIIRSIEDYGVFVELAPNLTGLAEPKENCRIGDIASVYIKSIIPEKMKIKLSIIDCFCGQIDRPVKYFDVAQPLKTWQYSPKCCQREIISIF